MKKTVLAVTMLSALSISGLANAYTEATNGKFTSTLGFTGTIVDDNPIWAWEVPAENQNWDSLVIDGQPEGENVSFTFPHPAITLIHGFMKTPAPVGGLGMTPAIKVGPTATAVTLSGDAKQDVALEVNGLDANGAKVTTGTLQLKAIAYIGGALKDADAPKYFGSPKAQEVLSKNQANFAATYPNPAAAQENYAQAEAHFKDATKTILSGAYLAEISDYKLSFPKATLPKIWNVAIPVTVTLK